MALSVIGAGFPRTGTLSLKLALEALGLGPCCHMTEVFGHPELWPAWSRAFDGEPVDWDEVFAGYVSTTDAPGCFYWRELADRYPQAKVILSVRDAERWVESAQATVLSPRHQAELAGSAAAPLFGKMAPVIMRKFGIEGGQPPARADLIAAYERHNAEVRRTIPADRLLDYRVSEGWEPLCRFLGRPVPASDFPRVNSSEEFWNIQLPA